LSPLTARRGADGDRSVAVPTLTERKSARALANAVRVRPEVFMAAS
jgi:hypothetical protein